MSKEAWAAGKGWKSRVSDLKAYDENFKNIDFSSLRNKNSSKDKKDKEQEEERDQTHENDSLNED